MKVRGHPRPVYRRVALFVTPVLALVLALVALAVWLLLSNDDSRSRVGLVLLIALALVGLAWPAALWFAVVRRDLGSRDAAVETVVVLPIVAAVPVFVVLMIWPQLGGTLAGLACFVVPVAAAYAFSTVVKRRRRRRGEPVLRWKPAPRAQKAPAGEGGGLPSG